MIAYFADRTMNILGQATTNLPEGMRIVDDLLSADVESGVDTFEGYLPYDKNTRKTAELCCDVGNYILLLKNGKNRFFTIINSEADTRRQEIYFYAEDAGLDLLNEYCFEYEAEQAYSLAWYIEKFTADSGFEIGINEAAGLTRKLSWDGKATASERVASVATQFGNFEISYSFEIENLTVTRKIINIHKQRGEDYGITLRLDREVTRILTTKSIEELATGLFVEGGTPEDAEVPITLTGYKYDDGDIHINGNCLFSRNAAAKWSRYIWNKEPGKVSGQAGHILKYYSYDTTDQATLCAHAVTELKRLCEVEVNYEVDIAYLPENVSIGDRVNIVDEAGKLYLSTRILKLEESEGRQKYAATLGEHLIKKSGISSKVEALAADFARQTVTVQRAEKIANNAKELATAAQESANTAAEGAENALSVANTAQTAANTATEAAGEATAKAQAAENAVADVQESVTELHATVVTAQAAANNAYNAAATAQEKAVAAEKAAQNAVNDANDAKDAAGAAQETAQAAEAKAAEAQGTAADAIEQAGAASDTAAKAKTDAEQAEKDVAALGESLATLSNTMQADYTRKTEYTETTANLQSQISQNAAGISSNAQMLLTVDETANNAKEQAETANEAAGKAQQQANAATANAAAAQTAANKAAQAAQAAQSEADTAKAAADAAQGVADKAKTDLEAAEAELATVKSRVDATEADIAAAETAVAEAKKAADDADAKAVEAATAAATAQGTANTAAQNANNAQQKANEAADTAALAQQLAESAKGDAEAAQQTADEAAQAARDAQSTAEQAVADAETAQSKADAAALAAQNAQSAADAADAAAAKAADDLILAQQELARIEADAEATAAEVEAAKTAVNTAQAAADAAQAAAVAAQGTADTAKANAAKAQTDADNAKTAASTAQKAADDAQAAADKAQADVDALAVRTAQCETDISQNAEAIALRATKEEVTQTLGGYTTKEESYAAIEERAEEITLSVEKVKETSDGNAVDIERANTRLQLLEDSFLSIVEDENGSTVLKQTSTGWTYDFSAMQDLLADNTEKLNKSGEYIKFNTYEGEPCIELGEGDSDFKVLITNTRIMFREGSQTPCFISNNEFIAENVSIKEELRFGQWFFSVRANGNLGLSWKGATE